MVIVLNGKRLETPLIQMPFAGRVMVGVVSLSVSERQPLGELGHLTINLRSNDKMPMVGHQTVTEQIDLELCYRVDKNKFERLEVCFLFEDGRSAIGAVQHMVDRSRRICSFDSTHQCTNLGRRFQLLNFRHADQCQPDCPITTIDPTFHEIARCTIHSHVPQTLNIVGRSIVHRYANRPMFNGLQKRFSVHTELPLVNRFRFNPKVTCNGFRLASTAG
jgi:hypothetical protein